MRGLDLSFAYNTVSPFYYNCVPPTLLVKSVAAYGLVFFAMMKYLNVHASMVIYTALTAAKFFALLVISTGRVALFI